MNARLFCGNAQTIVDENRKWEIIKMTPLVSFDVNHNEQDETVDPYSERLKC